MWTEAFNLNAAAAKIEVALKEKWGGERVLLGDIPFEDEDRSIPAVLVLSPGATVAHIAKNHLFSQYKLQRKPILDNEGYTSYFITETGVDALAILRINARRQGEFLGEKIGEWVQIDFHKQRLGLAIVTAQEANNSMARFWATAFVFDKE